MSQKLTGPLIAYTDAVREATGRADGPALWRINTHTVSVREVTIYAMTDNTLTLPDALNAYCAIWSERLHDAGLLNPDDPWHLFSDDRIASVHGVEWIDPEADEMSMSEAMLTEVHDQRWHNSE